MEYITSTPPRHLSWFSRAVILFSGFYTQFGWTFIGFGMIFVWVFVGNSELVYLLTPRMDKSVTGQVISLGITASVQNDQVIREVGYTYQVNGHLYEGKSYTPDYRVEEGDSVKVYYLSRNPRVSRLSMAGRALFSAWMGFLLVFPLVGLGFAIYGFRQNMKAIDLLINGKFAPGVLTSKKPTNTMINKQVVYAYTFDFEADDGQVYTASTATHETWLVEDQREELIVYAPADPAYAVVFDAVPGSPGLSSSGELKQVPWTGVVSLILPAVTLLVHGGVFWIFFR
ncbi:MAG: DUF3592 domain-containing protein [Bacteroidia bacterium]|jgi:hypothetical protein|nr:DUF3592 domain-containing protein [Bacteroidia bacterium]